MWRQRTLPRAAVSLKFCYTMRALFAGYFERASAVDSSANVRAAASRGDPRGTSMVLELVSDEQYRLAR